MGLLLKRLFSIFLVVQAVGLEVSNGSEPVKDCSRILEVESSTTHLSQDQLNAIREAQKGDYLIFAQKKVINGKERIVVLMGERHTKDQTDSQRGKDVLAQFSHRGQEGIDPSNYWFAEQLTAALNHKTTKANSAYSSAYDALLGPMTQQFEEVMVQETADRITKDKMTMTEALATLTPEHLVSNLEKTDGQERTLMEMILPRLNFDRMKEQLLLAVTATGTKSTDVAAIEPAAKITNYPLEKGYSPSLKERLAGIGVIVGKKILDSRACIVGGLCAMVAGMVLSPEYLRPMLVGEIVLTGVMAGTAVMGVFGQQVLASIDRRNIHMTNTLQKVFEADKSVDKLIIIVGMTHVPGIAELLEQRGFSTVDL